MTKRKEYNNNILQKCVEQLKSRDAKEIFEAVLFSAYLIEQAFKNELNKINPLLYYDTKNIGGEKEILIAVGKLPSNEYEKLKTIQASKCINQICIHKKEIAPHRANIEELFLMRNYILHSVGDFYFNEDSASESAVSSLKACRKYIAKFLGISTKDINLLTSSKFEKLQEEKYKKRLENVRNRLKEHEEIFKKISSGNSSAKIPEIEQDDYTWIEKELICPACSQDSLNKIGYVDFDWNPDGILENAGYNYYCTSCGIELSEYEYEIALELSNH